MKARTYADIATRFRDTVEYASLAEEVQHRACA